MSEVLEVIPPIAPSEPDESPTIADRVAVGSHTNSRASGAIVPAPALLTNVPLPNALTGKQAKDVERLLSAGFQEKARYVYTGPHGEHLMAVVRYEKAGEKQFRPLRCVGTGKAGVAEYDLRALDAPRPLYHLDQLMSRPEAPVLIVEGEKAADAAALRFPNYVCTTWACGALAVGKTDLRDLAGRTVVLWPDNDKSGREGMQKLAGALLRLECQVTLVRVPAEYPEKWDLADADPSNVVPEQAPDVLLASAEPTRAARLRPPVPQQGSKGRGQRGSRR